nr:peroxidase 3-like [Ipomoea batatas]
MEFISPRRHHYLILVCSFLLMVFCGVVSEAGPLKKNFYKKDCPRVEEIVQNITWLRTSDNLELAAKFLRMHFHDCFVRGCDGSILLDSTPTNKSEKEAIPNRSLAGYDVIDEIKVAVEAECPGIVSCADILALAARDSVSFQLKTPMWSVLMGRRDGSISQETEALANLPSPFSNFSTLLQNFASKGLDVRDLVILSGGHTIGVGHCNIFSNRLYNFTGKGDEDPSLSPSYADMLRTKCKNLQDTSAVEMDPSSSQDFDANYFVILKQNMGMFESDAALLTDDKASRIVDKMVDQDFFFKSFAKSMEKMGAIQVLTGTSGEVRKNCRVPNS